MLKSTFVGENHIFSRPFKKYDQSDGTAEQDRSKAVIEHLLLAY